MTPERLEEIREHASNCHVSGCEDMTDAAHDLLAYADELRRDAEAMATYLVISGPAGFCYGCNRNTAHPHAPDCLARRYAKKDDAP